MKKHTFLLCGTALVYGDFMDRGPCYSEKGLPADRTILYLDVSHLRNGRLYQAGIKKPERVFHLSAGQYLHDRNFCGGADQRRPAQAFSYVSLGLQQGKAELQRADPFRLRTGMVCHRAFF